MDIDGVILNSAFIFEEIFQKKLKGDPMWDYFCAHCNSERVQRYENISYFLSAFILLREFTKIKIILLTSRNEKIRKETEEKLNKEWILYDKLYMRKNGDYRESHVLKKEALEEIKKNYNIICFIDDDLNNCNAAKELGIFSLRKV